MGEGVDQSEDDGVAARLLSLQDYPTESVYEVVLQKSTPPRIRQLILYCYYHAEQVDGFV